MLAKKNLGAVLDLANQSLTAANEDQLRKLLDNLSGIIPFEAAIMCLASCNEGRVKSIRGLLNHSFNNEWLKIYKENNYIYADPVVNFAFESYQPFEWRSVCTSVAGAKTKEFFARANKYGLHNGLAFACNTPRHRSVSTFIALSIKDKNVIRQHKATLNYLLPHLHEAYSQIKGSPQALSCELTPREREILNWVREGKSTWDISMITAITERTVKFHLYNVFTKLNVSNRAHAVAKAMRHDLL